MHQANPGISWQQHITNDEVLKRAGIPSMFSILAKRRLRWLGHVARMENGRIPKDTLYGELATGSRPAGRPTLRYKDVCKRDLRAGDIAPTDLQALAADRNVWRLTTKSAAVKIEQKLKEQHEMKRQRRRVRAASDTLDDTALVCVPDLQEDLPLADWALQPQSPLQLDHGMTTKAQTHCLPRQRGANQYVFDNRFGGGGGGGGYTRLFSRFSKK